MRMKKSKN